LRLFPTAVFFFNNILSLLSLVRLQLLMPQKLRLKVVIVGAGLGGLAAAIATRTAGHDVLILEQAPALGEVTE
jgi:NADPH-dependent 2,4-dienoyl-CoA reductase/sulfur reductase-like enzyme